MKKSNERVLLYFNKDGATNFEASVEAVQQGANDLIQVFELFQPYKKIKSLDDFETLVTDPLTMFDKTLQANSGINLEQSGGKIPNASVLANLYDIDRPSYMAILTGQKIDPGSCKPCGKLKIVQSGKGVLSYLTYQKYQEYLLFNEGRFSIKEDVVELKKESLKVYAETPEQIEIWNYWHNVLDVLNSLNSKGYCGDLYAFQGLLKNRVMLSYATNKLALDEQSLYYEISQLKK